MAFVPTTALDKLLKLRKRIKGVQGGTSASKTISIEMILIDKAQVKYQKSKLISITSESMPHLKRGAIRDFKNIMQDHGYWVDKRWNATDFIYTFETGNRIEFFSLDMPHKVRGPRRDILFINEANNIPKETFDQLEVRTNEEVWLDWNPAAPFWWHEDILSTMDVDFIILTYKDNEGLPQSIVESIESRKSNKNWWTVYGLGQLGDIEGRIYTGWRQVDEVPHEARLERRGLDFGYSRDEAGLVDVYYLNGGYILDERLYQLQMSNRRIADLIANFEETNMLVIGDSAEPKSIDEIRSYGINIIGANKGPGSVSQGIQFVQDQKISVTKRSTNLLKEYRSYMWARDKDDRQLNVPEGGFDHLLDAARYAMESLRPLKDKPKVHVPDRVKRALNHRQRWT